MHDLAGDVDSITCGYLISKESMMLSSPQIAADEERQPTYSAHDGAIHDALLPARLHDSPLQAGDHVPHMELDDAVQLVRRSIQSASCSSILAASRILFHLTTPTQSAVIFSGLIEWQKN